MTILSLSDSHKIPFSVRGSFWSLHPREHGVEIRSTHGKPGDPVGLGIILTLKPSPSGDGQPLTVEENLTQLTLCSVTSENRLEICFQTADHLLIRSTGIAYELHAETKQTAFDCACSLGDNQWELNFVSKRLKVLLESAQPGTNVMAPWAERRAAQIRVYVPVCEEAPSELGLQEYASVPSEGPLNSTSFQKRFYDDFTDWKYQADSCLNTDTDPTAASALLHLWRSIVGKSGFLGRETVLMSKSNMCKVWNWDNCFNALALANVDPTLAWDQIMLFFDHQAASGAMPNSMSDREQLWTFTTPPIQGWTLLQLRDLNASYFWHPERLREIAGKLERWTDFWFQHRSPDTSGLPAYFHGCDSGWDNGTVFASGPPVQSPDLATLLVLQMEALAEIFLVLDDAERSKVWEARAEKLLGSMLDALWQGDLFVARKPHTGQLLSSESLMTLIPLVLGKRLPEDVRAKSLERLLRPGRFRSTHGLATEAMDSPSFDRDGYWRGAIWAPSTALLVQGLCDCGKQEEAVSLAFDYQRLCRNSGFAENFDPINGQGLRDPSYTWTASVYLHFARLWPLDSNESDHTPKLRTTEI